MRRPVVAVLDTGAGEHPWLPDTIVRRHVEVGGLPIGLTDPATDSEVSGVVDAPLLGELDTDSGHGTFIAGLIRQLCPDADILAIRIMSGDGVVTESDLLGAICALLVRQVQAQKQGRPDELIDVLSLSLGYYHEQPTDALFDHVLLAPLQALAATGVAVAVAAGNDSTYRPMYPAAFTPWASGLVAAATRDAVPLLSVGARNPDDTTIALFSNAGPWVSCHRRGSALVSTFPVTMNGAEQASDRLVVAGDGVRSTIDPDNFASGFGTWSGTSFAAPILAGELAATIFEQGDLDAIDPASCVARGWHAVTAALPHLVRP
jgi:subtilisin family serine protease